MRMYRTCADAGKNRNMDLMFDRRAELVGVRQRFLHFSAISCFGMLGKLMRVRV